MAKKKHKTKSKKFNKIMVLIDAENTTLSPPLKQVLKSLAAMDKSVTQYAYGDWSNSCLAPWKHVLNQLGIRLMEQPHLVPKKNLADTLLIIDAMEALYTKNYDTYIIISSDSDFTPLCQRLSETGKKVIVIGSHTDVVASLVNACDYYISTTDGVCIGAKAPNKVLKKLAKPFKKNTLQKKIPHNSSEQSNTLNLSTDEQNVYNTIVQAYSQAPNKDVSGFVPICIIGDQLYHLHASKAYTKLGYEYLTAYLRSAPKLYEIKNNGKQDTMRIK